MKLSSSIRNSSKLTYCLINCMYFLLDIRERFHIVILLMVVSVRNLDAFNWDPSKLYSSVCVCVRACVCACVCVCVHVYVCVCVCVRV